MHSTSSLLQALKQDFPTLAFSKSDTFYWSPSERIIYYATPLDNAQLLHEVAHAALGHTTYGYDIDLLKMERAAWDEATKLAEKYTIAIGDDHIQEALDTYRDWLHDRSLCPNCDATGIQSTLHQYRCLACGNEWRVNEARSCALRRYVLPSHKKSHS